MQQFPNKPISYLEGTPMLGRQVFGQDIQQLGENIINAILAIAGNSTFSILAGVVKSGSNYSNGYIILNSLVYYFPGGTLLNKYLIPDDDSVQLQLIKSYNDTSTHPTYRVYTVKINNSPTGSSTPQFVGSMNQYRLDLQTLLNLGMSYRTPATSIVNTSTYIANVTIDCETIFLTKTSSGNYNLKDITLNGANFPNGKKLILWNNTSNKLNLLYYSDDNLGINSFGKGSDYTFINGPDFYVLGLQQNEGALIEKISDGLWYVHEIYEIKNTAYNTNFGTGTGTSCQGNDSRLNNEYTKVINIGDWNMDTTQTVTVVHGLTFSKIISVEVFILNDFANQLLPINMSDQGATPPTPGGSVSIGTSDVTLNRASGGYFDSSNFNATSFNRGYIIIRYNP